MCRRSVVVAIALLGVVMLSDIARAERRQLTEIVRRSSAEYIDMGIELRVVERDPSGVPLVPGNSEPMRVVGEPIRRGGIVKISLDENGNRTARIVAPSKNPVVWFVSQAQCDLILHDGPAPWVLVQGSEGSGKTTVLCMFVAIEAVNHLGHEREIGVTAPTFNRLSHVKREIKRWWRPSWYRFSERYQKFTFHAGPTVQLVSAVQRSEEAGSPIQGANWVAHAGDELQDHFEREGDIEARGRSAPRGWYPRLNTSTFKDSSAWRTFRSACVANSNEDDESKRAWHVTKLFGLESPFISPLHWERLRNGGTMTPREYRRRVLAEELGPEAQLYHCWLRGENGSGNLRVLPSLDLSLHVEDVTAEILRPYAPPGVNLHVLAGNDPGKRQHVTIYLKAFRFAADVRRGDRRPRWFVVGETTSPDSTIEAHVAEVLKRLRVEWRCNEIQRGPDGKPSIAPPPRQVLVRIDPHSKTGDEHPGRDYYSIWRSFGIVARAANYDGDRPAQIKVESRINLVNTLLCAVSDSEDGTRRLFVACNENGQPLTKNPGQAEHVVDAFEAMERNEAGEAEWENKDRHDKSHWTAAIGYALWQVERENVHRRAS